MYIIIGLGNPGSKYKKTRHNAGFMFIERFADFVGHDRASDVTDWEREKKGTYESCEVTAGGEVKAMFVKPILFMNKSGIVVRDLAHEHKISPSKNLVIAHDDLDIELGKFKIQRGISPKLHRGVKSVEMHLENVDFLRMRLGVDSRAGDRSVPGDEYVLEQMQKDELEKLDEAIVGSAKQLRTMIVF